MDILELRDLTDPIKHFDDNVHRFYGEIDDAVSAADEKVVNKPEMQMACSVPWVGLRSVPTILRRL
jgi:hypothetical protein